MTKLSDTQSLILSHASRHEALLAAAPKNLPTAARQAVFRSMLKNQLLEEVPAPTEPALELEALRAEGIVSHAGMARALSERQITTQRGSTAWTHTAVARILARVG